MTNEELAEAVNAAWYMAKNTGTMCDGYPDIVAHLRALLAEQQKRAAKEASHD